ncbi:MAG: hypothetical protein EBU49_02175 [Proteobacteria bacterium]|nr:hypothetical protein [Pseudomonadota bacterium]
MGLSLTLADAGVSTRALAQGPSSGSGTEPASKPSDECHTAFDAVIAAAPKRGDYTNAVLDHLHAELYRFNKIETADVEMIFCRLSKIMGVDPDLSNLPQTISKTDPRGSTIEVTISAPTETWAAAAGYVAKATIMRDATTFMTLWWAGSQDSSKGYVIQGANPMARDSMKRLRYAQWDRTGTTQTVKVYATQFATTFLGAVSGASDSRSGGDNAHYGRVSYDTVTKAITAQSIEIRAGRNDAAAFKCVRTNFSGTIDGTVSGYRPAQGVEEATSGTNKDGNGMDGETGIVDATTTADHSGTPSPGSAMTATFDWSCSDINSSGTTGHPFASDAVSFTADPSTIFPN